MLVPTITLDRVWHIGSMDPSQVGANSGSGSLEGRCLSVSVCPNAWEAIARLGGNPLHELTRHDGRFLDVHAVVADKETRALVLDWATEAGLIEERTLWRAWSTDESGAFRYMTCATREEALDEALECAMADEESELEAPEGHRAVEPLAVHVGTRALAELTGMDCRPSSDATDAAVMAWAMVALPEAGIELDGLWWNELLDEASLSAPRGCLFPDRVGGWTRADAVLDDVDDWGEVDSMPASVAVEASDPATRPGP